MRCDECKHWSRGAAAEQKRAGDLVVHECRRALQWWDATEWTDEDNEELEDSTGVVRRLLPQYAGTKMFVQDASSYSATLYTAADFFCAHFEPKT